MTNMLVINVNFVATTVKLYCFAQFSNTAEWIQQRKLENWKLPTSTRMQDSEWYIKSSKLQKLKLINAIQSTLFKEQVAY